MIKNVTKKELRDFLSIARKHGSSCFDAGAFIYSNKVNLYLSIQGQGINAIVYNKEYVDIVKLIHYCNKVDYTLSDAVNSAHESIADMIESYYEDTNKERRGDVKWEKKITFGL